MKKLLLFFIFACALASMPGPPARADGGDGECDERQKFSEAKKKEKAGDYIGAYKFLSADDDRCHMNFYQDERLVGELKGIALKAARKLEKEGRHIDASEWYGKAGMENDSQRVIVAHIRRMKVADEDLENVARYSERITAPEYARELKEIASRKAQEALEAEKAAFSKKDYDGSSDFVWVAVKWSDVYGERDAVVERALKRGDFFSSKDESQYLAMALDYYDAVRHRKKAEGVRSKAKKLAIKNEKAGHLKPAIRYYEVAGMDDKAAELYDRLEEDEPSEEEVMRQMEGGMTESSGEERKRFREEQDSLEKELGL